MSNVIKSEKKQLGLRTGPEAQASSNIPGSSIGRVMGTTCRLQEMETCLKDEKNNIISKINQKKKKTHLFEELES